MYKVVIEHKNQKTLKALTVLAESLGFSIADPEKQEKKEIYHINGIPVERGDPTIDMQDLTTIFTDAGIDAKRIRTKSWGLRK